MAGGIHTLIMRSLHRIRKMRPFDLLAVNKMPLFIAYQDGVPMFENSFARNIEEESAQ